MNEPGIEPAGISGSSRSITYSELGFVALVIQHAKRMGHIILSSVASLTPPYFST